MEGGQASLVDGDIIFFNSLRHKSGQIWLTGDNRTGAGDGDDEQIIVKLNTLDDKYAKIVFIVQIYNGKQLQQHFGKVQNAFIRAVDAKMLKWRVSIYLVVQNLITSALCFLLSWSEKTLAGN